MTVSATDQYQNTGSTQFTWTTVRYNVVVANPGTQITGLRSPVGLQVRAGDSGPGTRLSYRASGLPAGLSINPTTGLISGIASAISNSTVTVAAGDQFGNGGATQFLWAVVKPGKAGSSASSLRGSRRNAKLKFTLGSGAHESALRTIAIKLPGGVGLPKAKKLNKRISIKGSTGKPDSFKSKLAGHTLHLTLASPLPRVTLTLGGLTVTAKHHSKLRIKISVTDLSNVTNTVMLNLRAP